LILFSMHDTNLRVDYDAISFLLKPQNPALVLDVHAAGRRRRRYESGLQLDSEAIRPICRNAWPD